MPDNIRRAIMRNGRVATLKARCNQATERVEVVTGYDDARARKFMREMGVAVVHDVEDVEAAAQAPQRARIIEETVERAIRVEAYGVKGRARAVPGRRRGSGAGRTLAGCA